MRPQILTTLITAAVLSSAHLASAGIFTYSPITGDEDSGISTALQYTAKADFFGPVGGRVINGVEFIDTELTGTGYFLAGPSLSLSGGDQPNNVLGETGGLVTDFDVTSFNAQWRDSHVRGAVSRFSGSGGLDIMSPALTAFKDFDVNVHSLDLRSIEYLFPAFPKLLGTIAGTATLDSVWTDVRF